MKNNLIIGLLVIISVVAITFGYYQMQEANLNQSKATEFERLYNDMKRNAEEQRQLAENQKKAAEYQMARNQECEKRLAELKAKKK